MKKIFILLCSCLFLIGCNTEAEKATNVAEATEELAKDLVEKNETPIDINDAYDEDELLVSAFISLVKNENSKAIAAKTKYPLKREYPLPNIENASEFAKQYDDIFDEKFKQEIIQSDIKEDWTKMGDEGIMLSHGILWLDLAGNLIAINRLSPIETEKQITLMLKERSLLHESIKDFDSPEALIETEKFRIRIDEVGDKYRYTSWGINQIQSEKPDLIINDGEIIIDGSGGNHHYSFKNGDFTYECHVTVIGKSSSSLGKLIIHKSDKRVLNEDIISIKN